MKYRNQFKKYNLQFFAEKKKGSEEDKDSKEEEDDDDDQDEDESEQSEKKKAKMFTQEELDEAIERRLKRERRKAKQQEKSDEENDKSSDKDDKVQALEAKIICLERGIKKESVTDVVTLAKAYIDEDTDLEEAIELVIEKYPHFAKSEEKKEELDNKQKVKGKDPNNKGKKTHDQTKNPWSKDHFNLTEQARILREDPELAEQYKASAQ